MTSLMGGPPAAAVQPTNGNNMATLQMEQTSKLLDFNQKLDINLLDTVVVCLYTGEGVQVGVLAGQWLYMFVRVFSKSAQTLMDSGCCFVCH